jgi:hypothetical protein
MCAVRRDRQRFCRAGTFSERALLIGHTAGAAAATTRRVRWAADHDPNAALVAVGSMTNDETAAPMATVTNSIATA